MSSFKKYVILFICETLVMICLILSLSNIIINKNRVLLYLKKENAQILSQYKEALSLREKNFELFLSSVNKEEKELYLDGWTTKEKTTVRQNPDIHSESVLILPYNTLIPFTPIKDSKEWVKININENSVGYVNINDISVTENEYCDFLIPDYPGFKSYMDYRTVTTNTSPQYQLLSTYGCTDNGFRKVNGRYCIAVGSYFNTSIGQYIDLILENGIVIECVMGDLKADIHTEDNNIFTLVNKCCSEFIIDINSLDSFVASTGNISRSNPSWDSPVKYIRVHNKNFFDTIGE
jgi:hypothetical protein